MSHDLYSNIGHSKENETNVTALVGGSGSTNSTNSMGNRTGIHRPFGAGGVSLSPGVANSTQFGSTNDNFQYRNGSLQRGYDVEGRGMGEMDSSARHSHFNAGNGNLENGDRNMNNSLNSSDNLFVANLQIVSLEKLVKSKLEVLFQQQRDANIELSGLYDIVLEQVEKPLIELALQSRNGNQVKTAQLLGINRNTLKKKIDTYKIRVRRSSLKDN